METVEGDAPESAVHDMENVVCPKIALDCFLSPVVPLHESPFVPETAQSDTSVVFQLTNVDSPLRRSVGATCQPVIFGEGGVGTHALSAHPYEHAAHDSVRVHCGALPYVRWQSLSAFAPVPQ